MNETGSILDFLDAGGALDEEYPGEDEYDEEEEDICDPSLISDDLYASVLFLTSISLYIILTFTIKRSAKCPGCCNGWGGILLSINFLENKTSRGMIVAGFILTTFEVLELINMLGEITGIPRLLKVLLRFTLVGAFNFLYLPLFHCISVNTLLRQVLGLTFVLLITPLMLLNATPICSWSEMELDKAVLVIIEYIFAGSAAIFLIYKFIFRIVTESRSYFVKSAPERPLKDPYQVEYMKNLLKKDSGEGFTRDEGKFTYRFRKFLYRNLPGFRFSISILVSIYLGVTIFFIILSKAVGETADFYINMSLFLEANRDGLNETMPNVVVEVIKVFTSKSQSEDSDLPPISIYHLLHSQLNAFCASFFIAATLAGIQVACTVVYMLKGYRRNVLSMYRQQLDDSPIAGTDNVSLVVTAIQFAGYQVAHMMWGYFLQFVVCFVLLLLFTEFIIVPVIFGYWGVIWYIIDWLIPFVVVMLLSKFIPRILVKQAFLVDRGNVFGLENRKCFFNMMFFMFYYNLLIGLISCVMRIIKVALIGLWFFPRLDMSIFPHTFEGFDRGYKAYLCLLRLEERQNNVILLSFIQLLNELHGKVALSNDRSTKEQIYLEEQRSPALNAVRRRQARNRWFVAYTLIHNESLRTMRRGAKKETAEIVCHSTVL